MCLHRNLSQYTLELIRALGVSYSFSQSKSTIFSRSSMSHASLSAFVSQIKNFSCGWVTLSFGRQRVINRSSCTQRYSNLLADRESDGATFNSYSAASSNTIVVEEIERKLVNHMILTFPKSCVNSLLKLYYLTPNKTSWIITWCHLRNGNF